MTGINIRLDNHTGFSAGWFVARGVAFDSEEYGVNLLYSVVGERMVLVKGQAQSIPRILAPAPWKSLNGRNPDQIGRMVALSLRMFVPKRTLWKITASRLHAATLLRHA